MNNHTAPVHGANIGIIILDTDFERLKGDIGNTATWNFPVQYRIVRNVTPNDVIYDDPTRVIHVFKDAIDDLVDHGAAGIITSCGFLALLQSQLSAYSPVPFLASPLLQIPLVEQTLPENGEVGVITSDVSALTDRHFLEVGASPATPVVGLDANGAILKSMRNEQPAEYKKQEKDVLETASKLLYKHPQVRSIVLECTNLSPFSAPISDCFNVQVYDVVTLASWLYSGIKPKIY